MIVEPVAKNLLSTEQAADLWNDVIGLARGSSVNATVSPQKMRRMCREGRLQRLGVDVIEVPGRYYVRKDSLLYFIWRVAQMTCRRCEQHMGLDIDATYTVGLRVSEMKGGGDPRVFNDLWMQEMHKLFEAAAEEDQEDVGRAAWGELKNDEGES